MTAALRAEWLKMTTTRALYGITAASGLLSAFIVFGLIAQGTPPWDLTAEEFLQLPNVIGISSGLFCLVLGLRAFTEEFRYATIAHTAFSDPQGTRTAAAKAIVAAAGGIIITVVALGLSFVTMVLMTSLSGGTMDLGGAGAGVALGLVGGGALWAVLGVGVGAIIRQPVPAMVTALLWVLVFENVAGLLLGPVARYLPGQTAQVLARGFGPDAAVAAGGMLLWAVGLWMIGWAAFRRRDVL